MVANVKWHIRIGRDKYCIPPEPHHRTVYPDTGGTTTIWSFFGPVPT